ncbi:MAG: tetratricopeptide repeat protein [Candidatus Helarchaeota archaeon]
MILGEPNFGISLFIDDNIGKITEIRDELFKKRLQINEEIKSISRKVEVYLPTTYELLPDENDPLYVQSPFEINKGLPVKVLKQEMSSGKRRIEVIQGKDLGSCAIRVNYYMPRTFKWTLRVPFIKNKEDVVLDNKIKAKFLTSVNIEYSQAADSITFTLNEGYTQILIFLQSELDYFTTKKNLLLLDPSDLEKRPIIEAASPDSKLFPVITFAYLLKSHSPLEKTLDYYIIGSILANAGKYEDAIDYFGKSLEANEQIGDALMRTKILLNLGAVHTIMKNNKEALQYYKEAYPLLQEQNNDPLITSCLIAMAKNYYELGEYEQALEYLNHILNIIRQKKSGIDVDMFADEMEESNILTAISKAYIGLGRFEDAVKYQKEALSIIKVMNDVIGESNGLVKLGETLMSVNRIGEAMGCFEQALRIRKQIGDDRGAADCLRKMGLAFYDRGKFDKAREYYNKALNEFEKIRDYISAEQTKKLIDQLKLQPFVNCELCSLKCSEKIRGMARSDALDPVFKKDFKKLLRDSLASKNMNALVNFILDQASRNMNLSIMNISPKEYAYCLFLHLSDEYLKKIKLQTRLKIEKVVHKILSS